MTWADRVDRVNRRTTHRFSEAVTFSPPGGGGDVVPVTGGVFSGAHAPVGLGQGVEMSAQAPRIECLEEEVAGVAQGWTAVIRGVTYEVTDVQPDGTGVSVFPLTEA